jgi:hypothetical protein
MLLTTIGRPTTVSALISTSNALPRPAANPGGIIDCPVTRIVIDCSPGGCTYSFNISGNSTADVGPAFSTYCSGTDVQQKIVLAKTRM